MATDSNNGIKILFEVASGKAAEVLAPLARACNRNSIPWACFLLETVSGTSLVRTSKR